MPKRAAAASSGGHPYAGSFIGRPPAPAAIRGPPRAILSRFTPERQGQDTAGPAVLETSVAARSPARRLPTLVNRSRGAPDPVV